jgi:Mitochondrial mRNA-processing protein COX24, C-terminal
VEATARLARLMGSLIKKRRKRMRKKKHKKMLKRTRFQRRAAGK